MNKNIKIGSNRSFGTVFFMVFLIIALWPLLNNNGIRIWAFAIALLFLILGILNSKILSPLNKIWFRFGIFLGKFIAPIVMGIIFFFLIVTPTGILVNLFKKDLLKLKKNNNKTYWIEKNDKNNSMKNQF